MSVGHRFISRAADPGTDRGRHPGLDASLGLRINVVGLVVLRHRDVTGTWANRSSVTFPGR